jgi:hypothetical protein
LPDIEPSTLFGDPDGGIGSRGVGGLVVRGGSLPPRIFLDVAFALINPSAGGLADGLSSDRRLYVPDSSAKCAGGCGRTCGVPAMMHLFLRGQAASAGGGLTYLRKRSAASFSLHKHPPYRRRTAGDKSFGGLTAGSELR